MGYKNPPASSLFPRNESIPRQARGSRSKPPPCITHPHDLGSVRLPSLFPKPLLPGMAGKLWPVRCESSTAARRQGWEAARGVEVFRERCGATRVPPGPSHQGPTPASSPANAASLPGTGSRWSPGRRRISSGLGMEQPHAAATNPNSPAGAEQAGLFIWEELSCCRSIRFPPKQRAARCLDHFSRST